MRTQTCFKAAACLLAALIIITTGNLCLAATDKVAGHEIKMRDGRVFVGVYDEKTGIITLWGAETGMDSGFKVQVEKKDIEAIKSRIFEVPRLTEEEKTARRKAADAAEKRREAERNRKLKAQAQAALTRVKAKLVQYPRTHDAYLKKSVARGEEIRRELAEVSAQIEKTKAACDQYRREIALLEATIETNIRYYNDRGVLTEAQAVTKARADAARKELAKLERTLAGECKYYSKLEKQLKGLLKDVQRAQKKYTKDIQALTNSKKSLENRIKKLDEDLKLLQFTGAQWEGKVVQGDASNRVFFVHKGVCYWVRDWNYVKPFRLSAATMLRVQQKQLDALTKGPDIQSIADMERCLKQ